MFTKQQLETLKQIGSAGLTTKLAAHDGYETDASFSPEKQVVSLLGQKYFTKKAAMRTISSGLAAMKKLGK